MSDLEDLLAFQLNALKIPHEREVQFTPDRRWRFDFVLSGQKIAVEVEGGVWSGGRHTRGAGFVKDLEKYNRANALGWSVLRYDAEKVESGVAVAQIERVWRNLSTTGVGQPATLSPPKHKEKATMPRKKIDPDNPLNLEPYEGEAVTEVGIEIPGAAGGLREPLAMDVVAIESLKNCTKGDLRYVVLELTKKKVRHEPAVKHDGWRRVDIFEVNGAAFVDDDVASKAIHDQRERVLVAKEKAEGTQRFGGMGGAEFGGDEAE